MVMNERQRRRRRTVTFEAEHGTIYDPPSERRSRLEANRLELQRFLENGTLEGFSLTKEHQALPTSTPIKLGEIASSYIGRQTQYLRHVLVEDNPDYRGPYLGKNLAVEGLDNSNYHEITMNRGDIMLFVARYTFESQQPGTNLGTPRWVKNLTESVQ